MSAGERINANELEKTDSSFPVTALKLPHSHVVRDNTQENNFLLLWLCGPSLCIRREKISELKCYFGAYLPFLRVETGLS